MTPEGGRKPSHPPQKSSSCDLSWPKFSFLIISIVVRILINFPRPACPPLYFLTPAGTQMRQRPGGWEGTLFSSEVWV